jgi:hypothetical protein
MHNKQKMLTGLNQNGTWSAAPAFATAHTDMTTTGVQAGPNPLGVMCAEHGKPDEPPATAGRPQGRLMAQRVEECGASEGRSVIERIWTATSSGAKAR